MAAGGMDFSYFNSAPLPYQFFGSQQQTAVRNPDFAYDEFQNVQSNEQFNPPFPQFQENFHYDGASIPAQRQGSARPPSRTFLSQTPLSPVQTNFEASSYPRSEINDESQRPRSSSEEKDTATPQQNKRKAQNRAAQRAFRERKEKHLKDLEAKLADLQKQSMFLDSENERLRKELAKVSTENEILKATNSGQNTMSGDHDDLFDPQGFKTVQYSRQSGNEKDDILTRTKFNPLQPTIIDDNSGEPLLNAGHTWDYIQAHELFQKGLVDVGDVCERLKKMARCHGQGPVFRESDIRKAIDESAVAGGRDELI